MANVRADVTSDFKKVYLTSDTDINTLYPVLEVYVNGILHYTSVVGGAATIDGVDYVTTTGVTNLDFVSTVTTLGTEWQFIVTPSVLAMTTDIIPDGVFTFKLLDVDAVTDIYNHELLYYQKNCCMAKKLNTAYLTSNSDVMKEAEDEVIKVASLIESTIASCAINDTVNAISKFKVVTLICEDCGCS